MQNAQAMRIWIVGLMTGLTSVIMAIFSASAADQDVQAMLTTSAAISVTSNLEMDFGHIQYSPGNSGTIRLGTDGQVTLNGATGLVASGSPGAGSVSIVGDNTQTIDISCETGGVLADGNSHILTLSATEIAIDNGLAFGSGTSCAGLNVPATSINLSLNAHPTVLIGGLIDATANSINTAATYDTAAAGGDPVTLRVVYQ